MLLMKKERILDVLFWLGFFSTLLLIFINSIAFILGIALVLLTIIVNFSTKDFLLRDVYALGYFIGAMLSVISIKQLNITTFFIGFIIMVFSILVHKFVTHRFEKKGKHEEYKIIHHKLNLKPLHFIHKEHKKEHSPKKRPHIISFLWAIFSIAVLVISVIKNNNYLLYLGLFASLLTVIINIVDVKQKPKPNIKLEKPKEVQVKIQKILPKEQKISSMKHYIALKHGKYETDIDSLYRIIEKFKKVKISEVKKVFNISSEKAEEWAKILEEHNLVELHYPAFGEPEIKWKQ